MARLQDDEVRRVARAELARQIACAAPGEVTVLIRNLEGQSYRYKIGVADALRRADPGWNSAQPEESTAILGRLAEREPDPTLRRALIDARARQRRP